MYVVSQISQHILSVFLPEHHVAGNPAFHWGQPGPGQHRLPHLHCSADLCSKHCQPAFSEKEKHQFSRRETLGKMLICHSWSCLCHTGWKGWKEPSFGIAAYKCEKAKFGQLCNIYSFTLLLCSQRELILDTSFLLTFKNHSQHKKATPSSIFPLLLDIVSYFSGNLFLPEKSGLALLWGFDLQLTDCTNQQQ